MSARVSGVLGEHDSMVSKAARRPRRISVVGATGSGKTYLSRLVSAQLHIPAYQLDSVRRDSAGRELGRDDFIHAVEKLVANEVWIIDGHYRDVRDVIWGEADTVLWLNYSLPRILLNLAGRFRAKSGSGRPKEAKPNAGAPAEEVVHASWRRRLGRFRRTLRERRDYGRIFREPRFANTDVVELKSPEAAAEWLRQASS